MNRRPSGLFVAWWTQEVRAHAGFKVDQLRPALEVRADRDLLVRTLRPDGLEVLSAAAPMRMRWRLMAPAGIEQVVRGQPRTWLLFHATLVPSADGCWIVGRSGPDARSRAYLIAACAPIHLTLALAVAAAITIPLVGGPPLLSLLPLLWVLAMGGILHRIYRSYSDAHRRLFNALGSITSAMVTVDRGPGPRVRLPSADELLAGQHAALEVAATGVLAPSRRARRRPPPTVFEGGPLCAGASPTTASPYGGPRRSPSAPLVARFGSLAGPPSPDPALADRRRFGRYRPLPVSMLAVVAPLAVTAATFRSFGLVVPFAATAMLGVLACWPTGVARRRALVRHDPGPVPVTGPGASWDHLPPPPSPPPPPAPSPRGNAERYPPAWRHDGDFGTPHDRPPTRRDGAT